MADDYFDVKLAFNPETGNVVPGAEALIYAMGDLTFSSPLPITDITGIPIAKLIASPTGVYPQFRVPSGEQDVMAVSGDMVTPITSKEGSRGPQGDPGPAGSGVSPAGSAAGQVLMSAGPTAQPIWANAPTGAGIAGAPSAWPTTFPAAPHNHAVGSITDATAVGRQVMTAADAQAARAAIGAGTGNGTSNLTLGTTGSTAAAGNHSHNAATLPFTPTGSIAATNVQDAILQAAASGGGTSSGSTLVVMYASGAYPTQPTSAPTGIKIRHFYGPTQYMGPTWPGVLDLYTYAELT